MLMVCENQLVLLVSVKLKTNNSKSNVTLIAQLWHGYFDNYLHCNCYAQH